MRSTLSGWEVELAQSSPSTTQHSLPGGRYPFPGPDFHRLDRASFAWRTATPSPWRTCTAHLPPVSRRTRPQHQMQTQSKQSPGALA